MFDWSEDGPLLERARIPDAPLSFLIDNQEGCRYNSCRKAGVAQLVEYKLPKLGVAGSRPVARSILPLNVKAALEFLF